MTRGATREGAALIGLLMLAALRPSAQAGVPFDGTGTARLQPTTHAPVPTDLNAFWYAPPNGSAPTAALTNFVKGVRLMEEEDKPELALPLLNQKALAATPVAEYARFYTARALLALHRYADAEALFEGVAAA
jgi:hypothetical protein